MTQPFDSIAQSILAQPMTFAGLAVAFSFLALALRAAKAVR